MIYLKGTSQLNYIYNEQYILVKRIDWGNFLSITQVERPAQVIISCLKLILYTVHKHS